MNTREDVRVIMITYNGDEFFKQQLETILVQKGIERIHIYDDHSNEASQASIQQLCINDERIQFHSNDRNLGVIPNIKKALANNLDAKYIALSDQDDIWLPNKLEVTLKEMASIDRSDTPALVYHDMGIIDQYGNQQSQTFWEIMRHDTFKHTFEANLVTNLITGAATLMNNTLASYAKDIPEDLNIYHDAWLGMVAYTMGEVRSIKQPLSLHRTHAESLTFSQSKNQTILTRLSRNLKQIVGIDKPFENQFLFIETFLETYKDSLLGSQKEVFEKFLLLRKKGYLAQKRFIWESQIRT